MRRRTRGILSKIAIALLVVAGGYAAFRFVGLFIPGGETNDVDDYDAVMKQWTDSGLVTHFPRAIPANAKSVRFSACPAYMQSGAHVQLRLKLPSEQISQIQSGLQKTHTYAGGGFFDHFNRDKKNNVATTRFRTAENGSFPAHYTLHVL